MWAEPCWVRRFRAFNLLAINDGFRLWRGVDTLAESLTDIKDIDQDCKCHLVEVFLNVSACLLISSLRNLFISSSILLISLSNLSLMLLNSVSMTENSPIFIGTLADSLSPSILSDKFLPLWNCNNKSPDIMTDPNAHNIRSRWILSLVLIFTEWLSLLTFPVGDSVWVSLHSQNEIKVITNSLLQSQTRDQRTSEGRDWTGHSMY